MKMFAFHKTAVVVVAILAAFFITQPAFANSIDTTDLTPEQIQELQARADDMKPSSAIREANKAAEVVTEWSQIGAGIGHGIAAAARETGVVANEFAATPVGKMTTAVIIYKVVGTDVISFVVGFLCLISIWSFSIWILKTLLGRTKETTYGENGKKRSVITKPKSLSTEQTHFAGAILFFTVICSLALLKVMIP